MIRSRLFFVVELLIFAVPLSSFGKNIYFNSFNNLNDFTVLPNYQAATIVHSEAGPGGTCIHLAGGTLVSKSNIRIPVEYGKYYELSCLAKSNDIHTRISIYIQCYDSIGHLYKEIALDSIHANEGWSESERFFAIDSPDVNSVSLRMCVPGKMFIDEIILKNADILSSAKSSRSPLIHISPEKEVWKQGDRINAKVELWNCTEREKIGSNYFAEMRDVDGHLISYVSILKEKRGIISPGGVQEYDMVFPESVKAPPGRYNLSFIVKNNSEILKQSRSIGIMPISSIKTRSDVVRGNTPVYFMLTSGPLDLSSAIRIKRWGFDVIDYDVTWGDVEPGKREFDFTFTDKLVSICKQAEIGLGIRIVAWNLPAWVKERSVSDRGMIGVNAPAWSDVSRIELPELWKAIAIHYKNEPTVFFYSVTTGLNDCPMSGSFEHFQSGTEFFDYSAYSAAYWRNWLKQHNYSLQQISTLYGHDIKNWQEIVQPNSQTYKYIPFKDEANQDNDKIFRLFCEFNAQGVADVLTASWASIRSIDANIPILWKAGGVLHEGRLKGFDYNRILDACRKMNIVVTDSGLPNYTFAKLDFCRNKWASVETAGELGELYEKPPMMPERVMRGFWGAIRTQTRWVGLCLWSLETPSEAWASLKPLLNSCYGSSRWNEDFYIYGGSKWQSYTQEIWDFENGNNSPYTRTFELINDNAIQAKTFFDTDANLNNNSIVCDPGSMYIPDNIEEFMLRKVRAGGQLWLMPNSNTDKPNSEILRILNRTPKTDSDSVQIAYEGKGTVIRFPSHEVLNNYLVKYPGAIKWESNNSKLWACLLEKEGQFRLVLLNRSQDVAHGKLYFSGKLKNSALVSDGDGFGPIMRLNSDSDGYVINLRPQELRSFVLMFEKK